MTWANAGNTNLRLAVSDAWQGSGGAGWPGRAFSFPVGAAGVGRIAYLGSEQEGKGSLQSLWLTLTLAPSSLIPSAFGEGKRAGKGLPEIARPRGQEQERETTLLSHTRGMQFPDSPSGPRIGQDLGGRGVFMPFH